ncbi:multiheme c-type cytochrome [uncultured Ilyobacter sp.]|uniref:multiheme c-type cytochrome n=1 Tax=uncultured Ilyobacter sp. TaxID=544433 RepID=UPI0029F467EF|nr:multiheme c-type cytochrome [uncultured Ilyobacter sp.]
MIIGTLPAAQARSNIRDAFFDVYPDAVGTTIETVPSQPNHCGMCHFEFTGGGPRNPYGQLLEAALPNFSSNPNGRRQAVQSIENEDPDGDGFTTLVEVTDVSNFSNTPTFPGYTPANISGVTSVDIAELQSSLVPSSGSDTTPPQVVVLAPNGGETLVGNTMTTVQWSAADTSGIASIDIYASYDGGATFQTEALGLTNSGSYTWFPDNRPAAQALLRVVATDNAFNEGADESDSFYAVEAPPGGIVPTTLRDFDMPGSQPFEGGVLNDPAACQVCHGGYDEAVEPFYNWSGSMMAQAGRDLLMMANMAIANQDAPDSGDLCLRCHFPRGWLQGRSVPTDGSGMLASDATGVACDLCHRLVDPIYDPAANPAEDEAILAAMSNPGSNFGAAMMHVDPTGARRGPFVDATGGHPILVSPFHREAALCGTCHDVNNPAFERDPNGNYVPGAFDEPATNFSSHSTDPVERTYSEWFYSDYNTPGGVYNPAMGGNKDYVSICQDCHMRDVTGQGCNFDNPPVRDDLPLHDMTGASTWYPSLIGTLYPGEVNEAALAAGIERARYMLQNAADLAAVQEEDELKVTITNNTGHKLPSGYPEGRRMWINVKFYDDGMSLVGESAAYDPNTGNLDQAGDAKVYEILPGLDETVAAIVGVEPGPSFHFVLNNKVYKDNRIPPRGFTNLAYDSFGGSHVAYSYPDGQYWDDTYYEIPAGATSAAVTVYFQSTSKEFIEHLRDDNVTDNTGQQLYDLWANNGKCPPEVMETLSLAVTPPQEELPGDLDGDGDVDLSDLQALLATYGKCPGDDGYNPDANLTDDAEDCITLADLQLLLANYGSSS